MGVVLNGVTVVPCTYAIPIHTIFVDTLCRIGAKNHIFTHGKRWCLSWHHKIAFVGGKQESYKLQE